MARKKKGRDTLTVHLKPSGPPIALKQLAQQLLLKPEQLRHWVRMGAPMAPDGLPWRPVVVEAKLDPLFASEAAVQAWLANGGLKATHLGTVERGARGMGGAWGLFRREGWARAACKVCDSGEVRPFETKRRQELGDHVLARVERVTSTLRGPVPKVLIRCWCTARCVALFPLGYVPTEQRKLIPVSPRITHARRLEAGLAVAT